MTTKKIYGPWIKWNGGKCPVPPDTRVRVERQYGSAVEDLAKHLYWFHDLDNNNILTYCTVTEQADLDAAENLLLNYGYTITPPAKPLTFEDVTPMTDVPPRGTTYWVIQPFNSDGVSAIYWVDDDFDKSVMHHRMAYLEKEHALIAARHIFGLKGAGCDRTPQRSHPCPTGRDCQD